MMEVTHTELALFAWAIIATAVAFARGDRLKLTNSITEHMLENEGFYKQVRAERLKRKER